MYSCHVREDASLRLQNTYPLTNISVLSYFIPTWNRTSPDTANSQKEGGAKSEYVVFHWQDTQFHIFWSYESTERLLIKKNTSWMENKGKEIYYKNSCMSLVEACVIVWGNDVLQCAFNVVIHLVDIIQRFSYTKISNDRIHIRI